MAYIREYSPDFKPTKLKNHNLTLDNCRRRFRGAFSTKSSVFQRNRRISRIISRDNNQDVDDGKEKIKKQ